MNAIEAIPMAYGSTALTELTDKADQPYADRANRRVTERFTGLHFEGKRWARLQYTWNEGE